jgi:hypothetical protein
VRIVGGIEVDLGCLHGPAGHVGLGPGIPEAAKEIVDRRDQPGLAAKEAALAVTA